MKTKIFITAFISFLFIFFGITYSQTCTQCDNSGNPTGTYASEIGQNTTASGPYSFAGGINSSANGGVSFAFGSNAIANYDGSVSFGTMTTSDNNQAFAIGSFCKASGTKSFVLGNGINSSTLLNNPIANSMMIGINSDRSTLFVGNSGGIGLTGKIGIGDVTDPQAKLHIKADNGDVEPLLFMEPYTFTGGESAKLRLGTMDYGISSGSGKLYFVTGGNYIFNSPHANVGIGTLNPTEPLEVNGNIKQAAGYNIISSTVKAPDINGLKLYDYTSNGITIKNSGKVGIGITSPMEKLEVAGNIKQSAGSRTLTQEIRALDVNGLKLNNSSGNGIVINNSGNVGIGMNPTNKLDVAGTVNATNFTGNGAGLTNATDYKLDASYSGTISTNGSLILGINYYTGTDQDDITITDPQFEVRSSSETNRKSANFVDEDGRRIFLVPKLSDFGYNPIAIANDAGIFWSDGDAQSSNQNELSGLVIGPHKSDSVGTPRGIKIDKDGNVGIGKAVPTAMLDVNGDAKIDDGLTVGTSFKKLCIGDASGESLSWGTSYIGFNAKRTNNSGWQTESDGANNGGAVIYTGINGDIVFSSLSSTGSGNQSLNDADIKNNAKMIITSNGNIKVQELEVKVNIWSDHVFDNEYKLLSLKETEEFIVKNKHLPGIPSEKEVMENGINVGEMNAMLLQKIEELTLHIINQEKRIQELEMNYKKE